MDHKSTENSKKNIFFNHKKAYSIAIILLIISIVTSTALSNLYIEKSQSVEKENNNLTAELSDLKKDLNITNFTYENLSKEIFLIKNSTIKLRNPTFNEVKKFIKKDKTDEINYSESDYNCAKYSRDVNNNAERNGFRCGYVIINPDDSFSHAIVSFNTTDNGLVFFEPQNDRQANISIGKDYWSECINPPIKSKEELVIKNYVIYW